MDVYLWQTRTDVTPLRAKEFELMLARTERDRAARYKFDRDRRRFVVRRAFLRWVLGRHLEMHPAQVQIVEGQGKKPRLVATDAQPSINFNLSHSGETAICGIVKNRSIGVDFEQIRTLPDIELLAKTVLSSDEMARWSNLPEESKAACFMNVFSRKEAIGKADGGGLSSGLKFAELPLKSLPTSHWIRINRHETATDWMLSDLCHESSTTGCLVVELFDTDNFSSTYIDIPMDRDGEDSIPRELVADGLPEEFQITVRRFSSKPDDARGGNADP